LNRYPFTKTRNQKSKIDMKQTIRLTILTTLLLASAFPVLTALADDDNLNTEADKAIKALQNADSGLANHFSRAAGYAVFPSVGKGGLFFGAEHGNGIVYENGKPVGEATLTEINVGAQVGGQTFYEVIFFETAEALANFKESNFEMSAKVSAVIAAEGASVNARYREGVMVFTLPRSGLMAQATVGGQKFKYKPSN
jgi:lipid-binding SYLF domain-containing protein